MSRVFHLEHLEFEHSLGGDVAVFSPDRRYRYALVRCPDRSSVRTVVWIMLNPSTADAFTNDPTVARVVRRSLDFDRVVILNLWALRSPYPRVLREAADPVGPDNDEVIRRFVSEAETVVAAWGAFAAFAPERIAHVRALVDRPMLCLGFTLNGQPRHPLYVSSATQLVAVAAT